MNCSTTQPLGSTNFLQNVNLRRALEGELARTMKGLKMVHSARVHLVLPQRQLFSREKQEATASVALKLRAAGGLSNDQISAIQHLVAAAVPELKPERVSIIDDRGNLLARGDEKNTQGQRGADLEERRSGLKQRKARMVDLLERQVGVGKVRCRQRRSRFRPRQHDRGNSIRRPGRALDQRPPREFNQQGK